jgi:hypothetical protein
MNQSLLPKPPISAVKNVAQNTAPKQASKQVQPPSTPSNAVVTPELANGYRIPDVLTIQHAVRLSIIEDKPIMMDYWTSSLDKKALIGVKDNKEKLLVKDAEQYTSPVSKIFRVASEYIIMTENSIYIVDFAIPTKKIST